MQSETQGAIQNIEGFPAVRLPSGVWQADVDSLIRDQLGDYWKVGVEGGSFWDRAASWVTGMPRTGQVYAVHQDISPMDKMRAVARYALPVAGAMAVVGGLGMLSVHPAHADGQPASHVTESGRVSLDYDGSDIVTNAWYLRGGLPAFRLTLTGDDVDSAIIRTDDGSKLVWKNGFGIGVYPRMADGRTTYGIDLEHTDKGDHLGFNARLVTGRHSPYVGIASHNGSGRVAVSDMIDLGRGNCLTPILTLGDTDAVSLLYGHGGDPGWFLIGNRDMGSGEWQLTGKYASGNSKIQFPVLSKGLVDVIQTTASGTDFAFRDRFPEKYGAWVRPEEWGRDVVDLSAGSHGKFGISGAHSLGDSWVLSGGYSHSRDSGSLGKFGVGYRTEGGVYLSGGADTQGKVFAGATMDF